MKKIDEKLHIFLKRKGLVHTIKKEIGVDSCEEDCNLKRIYGEDFVKDKQTITVEENDDLTPEELDLLIKLDIAENINNIKNYKSSIRNIKEKTEEHISTIKKVCVFFAVLAAIYISFVIITGLVACTVELTHQSYPYY